DIGQNVSIAIAGSNAWQRKNHGAAVMFSEHLLRQRPQQSDAIANSTLSDLMLKHAGKPAGAYDFARELHASLHQDLAGSDEVAKPFLFDQPADSQEYRLLR